METGQIKVVWVASEGDAKRWAAAAREAGGSGSLQGRWKPSEEDLVEGESPPSEGDRMEPLTAAVLIVGAGWLIQRLSDVISDHRHPASQVIDMRTTPAVIRTVLGIKPPGTVIVLKMVDGDPVETRYSPDRRDEALAGLMKLPGLAG